MTQNNFTEKLSSCLDLKIMKLESLGSRDFFRIVLENPGWSYHPGQFVMVRPGSWSSDPLLPRPFSIADLNSMGLILHIQAVGRGTGRMAGMKPGETLSVWGPLGRGFTVPDTGRVLLLAGGMGLAPFVGLSRVHGSRENMELIFGHRSPLACYPFEQVAGYIRSEAHQQESIQDIEAYLAFLENKIRELDPKKDQVLACGPEPFLKAVAGMCLELGVSAQVSMEKRMACGIGACLGCVVPIRGEGLVQSCTCGPVFSAGELEW